MDLNKKSLPKTKNTKAIPQHESFYPILARIKLGIFFTLQNQFESTHCKAISVLVNTRF
jgi:hypothetical protein